jgi:hypothetical protein
VQLAGRKSVTEDLVRNAESPPTRCESIRPPEGFQHDPEYRQPVYMKVIHVIILNFLP